MIGRLYGGAERIEETVDFPVAKPPVRPMISILMMFDKQSASRQVSVTVLEQ